MCPVSSINQCIALSDFVDDFLRRRPLRVTTKPFHVSRRRKRQREDDEALSIVLKESRPFSTVALSHSR